jgi:ATP-binding cassette subfamily B protein
MLGDLGWLAARGFADAPGPCAVWAATAVARGLLVPAQLWLTKLLLDALQARLQGGSPDSGHALRWLGALAATLLAGQALGGVEGWVRVVARERQGPAAQARVLARAAELDLAAFEDAAHYDRVRRVLDGTEARVPDAVAQVIGLGQVVPSFLGYSAALALLSPTLLAVGLGAALPTVLAWTALGQAAWGANARFTRLGRLAAYYAGLLTGRPAAAEVRLYGLEDYAQERWARLFLESRLGHRRQAFRNGTGLRALGTASTAASMAALWVVALQRLHPAAAGTLAVLFQSVEGVFGAGFRIGDAARQLGEHSGFAAECRSFFGPPQPPAEPGDAGAAAVPVAVHCRGITFTYPGAAAPTLHGIDLDVAPGEMVALVGENGAGKTTLAKLLLGLYAPEAGEVTVGGRPPAPARGTSAAVFQDFARYPLSLQENVTLGRPGQPDRLRAVLAAVGAGELAATLPEGPGTLLGADVGGTDLSGGQWQMLAMARALWPQPHLLVLDEPTAALDPLAELAAFAEFAALARGRTTILVSHRLGICRLADRVVVLQGGRVIEEGPHAQLLAAGGEYARMFAAQARWYA